MRKSDQRRSVRQAQRLRQKDARRRRHDARLALGRRLIRKILAEEPRWNRDNRYLAPRFLRDIQVVAKRHNLTDADLCRLGINDYWTDVSKLQNRPFERVATLLGLR